MKRVILSGILAALLAIGCHAGSLNQAQEELAGFHTVETEAKPVRIAIIDTGIDPKRLDGTKLLPGKSYVSDDTTDLVGHGTRIASLILGAADGEEQISPLAPNALLIPLVYYSKYPSGVPKNGGVAAICQGIYDAVEEYSAKILVISSGVYEDDPEFRAAVAFAEEKGVLLISAAGNDGDERKMYPAAYDTVVSVASVGNDGALSPFSQRSEGITLAAPGEGLHAVSLRNGDFFEECSGTSYACAYVAALAARLMGEDEGLTAPEIRELLVQASEDITSSEAPSEADYGILDAEAAHQLLAQRLGVGAGKKTVPRSVIKMHR